MNRDDIIRMAREAGIFTINDLARFADLGVMQFYVDELEHFAALVAAAERGACAKACEETRGVEMKDDLRAAAQMALQALEQLQGGCTDSDDGTVEAITVWCPEIITALRAALAEPEPFHIWSAYSFSPNATWGQLASEWEDARGNPDLLKTFVNTVLGECWEDEAARAAAAEREACARVCDEIDGTEPRACAAAELRRLHALNAELVEALRDVLSTHPHGEALEKKGNRPRRSILAVRAGRAALADSMKDTRICTCHPDDNPPKPCPRKYALSECREAALAEPVAWMVYTLDGESVCITDNPANFTSEHRALPLYTAPPQRKPLTDEEIGLLTTGDGWSHLDTYALALFARAIERAHGIGGVDEPR